MIPPVDRDDELDALLGALGNPAGSTPVTSADRILAMAAPAVVVPLPKPGIPRWVLGGSIAAATMFGFVGGAAAMYLAGGLDRVPEVADVRIDDAPGNTNGRGVATPYTFRAENDIAVATTDALADNEAQTVATLSTSGGERVPPPGAGGSSASQGEASLSARASGGARASMATRSRTYKPVAIRTIHEVAPLAPGIVGDAGAVEEAIAASSPTSTRPRFVGSPVSLGGHGSRPTEDPFASIPFDDASDEAVATEVATRDPARHTPHVAEREDALADDAPSKGRTRTPLKAVARPEAVAQVARGRSPFSLAFDVGGRGFAARGERGATGLSTGANLRLDLTHGAVRPVLEAGLDAGAGLFPAVGPIALAPHLGAELELAVGAFTPSVGWAVVAPLRPARPDERLALFTGPTVGLDIGRQDRPHFRARLDVELPTDPMMDAVVEANVAVSGGVEIPLGTW